MCSVERKHNNKQLKNSKSIENKEENNLKIEFDHNVLIEGNRRSQNLCQKAKDESIKKKWKERNDNGWGKRKMGKKPWEFGHGNGKRWRTMTMKTKRVLETSKSRMYNLGRIQNPIGF
jgi:hypothetical protein